MALQEQPWQRCSICRDIPESAHESRNRGSLETSALPASTERLQVVGAPYCTDAHDRGDCFKFCPECQTVYEWSKDYEFDVAAMVDTSNVSVRRLGPAEAVVTKDTQRV